MKIIDFAVVTPCCNVANAVALEVEDEMKVFDGAHFISYCGNCGTEVKVNVSLNLEVVERLLH